MANRRVRAYSNILFCSKAARHQERSGGCAKDATKIALGGMAAKTGEALCTSGIGCAVGGWMTTFGLSEVIEGGGGLYNRYNGISEPGDNPLRLGV